jgi:DNA-binding IclR family transcriptional regulator
MTKRPPGEATLKEMSIALSLAPSTCHRLIELLGREGLIEQDSTHRRYRVGVEMFRISAQVQSKNDIRSIALPFLRELAAACDETCVLSIYLPVEGKIFFAERADSSSALRYQVAMNVPVSVLWGASGRSILAFLDSASVDRIYQSEGRAPGSGEALPSRRALDNDLAAIRKRGYEVTHGQKIAGAVGISAPVFGVGGKVVGSLCITVPESRIKAKDHPHLGALVTSAARRLSQAIGSPRLEDLPVVA